MNEKEKGTIKYIKSRLYGNEGCDYIDVSQEVLKNFVPGIVIENIEKDYIPVKDKIEELQEELEIMKVDNMYGRYKEYGGKTKWERLFATKYGMHDALQELLEGRE